MGWREPEPQDVGRVVFNRSFKRIDDANLIRAREILRNSYLSRHGDGVGGAEPANVYFDQAMKSDLKQHGTNYSRRSSRGTARRFGTESTSRIHLLTREN